MKKNITFYVLVIGTFLIVSVIVFCIYVGLQFKNIGKQLYEFEKKSKENNEAPLDSIKNSMIKIIDSVDSKDINKSSVHRDTVK